MSVICINLKLRRIYYKRFSNLETLLVNLPNLTFRRQSFINSDIAILVPTQVAFKPSKTSPKHINLISSQIERHCFLNPYHMPLMKVYPKPLISISVRFSTVGFFTQSLNVY